jgi:hypothetical protein
MISATSGHDQPSYVWKNTPVNPAAPDHSAVRRSSTRTGPFSVIRYARCASSFGTRSPCRRATTACHSGKSHAVIAPSHTRHAPTATGSAVRKSTSPAIEPRSNAFHSG